MPIKIEGSQMGWPPDYPRCASCGAHIVYLQQTGKGDECGDCVRLARYEAAVERFIAAVERLTPERKPGHSEGEMTLTCNRCGAEVTAPVVDGRASIQPFTGWYLCECEWLCPDCAGRV